nr:bifunctional methylenetetrahydrofolate dehydrogenase/methenyltetrahydrofolate cyclohydrolase FolD [Maliibacterium massiliense]
MAATILDGKAIAQRTREQLALRVADFRAQHGYAPGLVVILVGEDPASQVYVRNKHRACQEVGMRSIVETLAETTTQEALLAMVARYNADADIHGILVQMPLPRHIDEKAVINAISPQKDVDGFHPMSAGALMVGEQGFVPCTPRGVITLIEQAGVDIAGKHAVVVGRSNIVGKPVAMLLLQRHATVTICHSRTQDLGSITRQADILVAAVGRPQMIRGDMIKPGAVVIDVGINRVPGSKKLYGDVAFDEAVEVAGAITPVPGGVGPMTIAMLLHNTLDAALMAAQARK